MLGTGFQAVTRLLLDRISAAYPDDPRYAGLSVPHYTVLDHMTASGTRVTQVAALLNVTKQAVKRTVDELQQCELVERRPDPDDGRAKLVTLTEEGERIQSLVRQREADIMESLGLTVWDRGSSAHSALQLLIESLRG